MKTKRIVSFEPGDVLNSFRYGLVTIDSIGYHNSHTIRSILTSRFGIGQSGNQNGNISQKEMAQFFENDGKGNFYVYS